jgi:DNA-binding transcriptional regulator YiaG
MQSGLKALHGPRVQVRVVDKFSGSGAAYFLRAKTMPLPEPVSVARLLIRCSVTPTKAKNAVERMNEAGSTALELPSAPADIQERLAAVGVEALKREARPADVAGIRLSLGMTQEEFAAAYGFSTATIRNWEQRRSEPDAGARAFLKVIETHPDVAAEAVTGT